MSACPRRRPGSAVAHHRALTEVPPRTGGAAHRRRHSRPGTARSAPVGAGRALRPGPPLRGPGRIRTFEGRTGRFTVCSLWPLGHRPAGGQGYRFARGYCFAMPTFDVVSEVDMQEVRNAVDQANREATTRFDFKGTDSTIELNDKELILASSTEDRLRALYQVLQEKLVKREVSLKSFDVGKIEEASKGTARQRLGHPGRHLLGPRQEDQPVHQGPGPEGRVAPRPRASSCGSPARSATTSRPPSPPSRPRTSGSRCSSTTSATERPRAVGGRSGAPVGHGILGPWTPRAAP